MSNAHYHPARAGSPEKLFLGRKLSENPYQMEKEKPMAHENEYFDNMMTMLELIWGEDYMAPGGPGNVARMLSGMHIAGRRVLDSGEMRQGYSRGRKPD